MALPESSGGISSLPIEITWNIFGRLPAKSIGRSRCVSKRWLSLTTDPKFVATYAVDGVVSSLYFCSQSQKPELFHILDRSIPSSPLPLPLPSALNNRGIYPTAVIHSCNGLVLFHVRSNYDMLYVSNPSTRKYVEVPYPPNEPDGVKPEYLNFSLTFHPSTCPRFKIFAGNFLIRKHWHDDVQRGYSSNVIYRFSSETWSWEKILTLDHYPSTCYFRPMLRAYWMGCLCWIADGWLQCLDVNTETMTLLPLPPPLCPPAPTMKCVYAGTPDGRRLHCCVSNSEFIHVHDMDVYEMESKSSGWSLLYHVDLRGIVDAYPTAMDSKLQRRVWVRIHWFFRGRQDREEDNRGDQLIITIPYNVVVYNIKYKTFSNICDNSRTSVKPNGIYYLHVYPHIDSLHLM